MNPVVTVSIGFAGVFFGSLSSIVITFINRRFDDRRHLREVAIKSAFDNFRMDWEYANVLREEKGTKVVINPVDTYTVHWLMLAELISDKKITAANVAEELKRIRAVSREAAKAAQ